MNDFESKKARLKVLSEQMLSNAEIPTIIAPILQVTITTSLEKIQEESQIDSMLAKAKSLIHFVETGDINDEEYSDYTAE